MSFVVQLIGQSGRRQDPSRGDLSCPGKSGLLFRESFKQEVDGAGVGLGIWQSTLVAFKVLSSLAILGFLYRTRENTPLPYHIRANLCTLEYKRS